MTRKPVAEILPPNMASERVHGVLRASLLKDMVMEALDRAGQLYAGEHGSGVDYLAMIAVTHPQVFGALLGRVLPLQVHVKDDGSGTTVTRIENVVLNAPEPKEPPRVVSIVRA